MYRDVIEECCTTLGLTVNTFFTLAVSSHHHSNQLEIVSIQIHNYRLNGIKGIPDYFKHYAQKCLAAHKAYDNPSHA